MSKFSNKKKKSQGVGRCRFKILVIPESEVGFQFVMKGCQRDEKSYQVSLFDIEDFTPFLTLSCYAKMMRWWWFFFSELKFMKMGESFCEAHAMYHYFQIGRNTL